MNLGMIGMHGSPVANRAMNSADLLILIGARVGDRAIMSPMGLSQNAHIVHIDIDPAEIGKNMDTHIPLVGDAKRILAQMTEKLPDNVCPDWTASLREENARPPRLHPPREDGVNPRSIIASLCRQAEKDAVLAADVGQNQIWSARGFKIPQGRFLTSGGMGTMGYSIPAAYGAKLAAPERQVVAVCGDGSFQMQMMELATIAANRIPVKIIVMNNMRLGMVRELQDNRYAGNKTAVFLDGNPDFVRLAGAYGLPCGRLSDNERIDEAIAAMLSSEGPYLLECAISPEEPTL